MFSYSTAVFLWLMAHVSIVPTTGETSIRATLTSGYSYGVGASNATVAHAALQVPRAALQARMAAGAAAAATTVPKVKPAPA